MVTLLLTCLAGALCGTIAAVTTVLIGGVGVMRGINRRFQALEDDVDQAQTRITREIKSRAGQRGVEGREKDQLLLEMAQLAQQQNAIPENRVIKTYAR